MKNCESFKGFNFIYTLVLCPCDAQLSKRIIYKFFDNIIKFNNK